PGRSIVLAATEHVAPVDRGPAAELDGAEVAVPIVPARAHRCGTDGLGPLPDSAVGPGIEGVRAGELERVEIGMDDTAAVSLSDFAEVGAAVARRDDGNPAEHGVVGIGGVDRDRRVVPPLAYRWSHAGDAEVRGRRRS